MKEFKIENIDYIEFFYNKNKLIFSDISGKHRFKISNTDIYGFDQTEQIERLKTYVNKISKSINNY